MFKNRCIITHHLDISVLLMILLAVVQNTIHVFAYDVLTVMSIKMRPYIICLVRKFWNKLPRPRNWKKQDPQNLSASQFGSSGRLSASELY